MMCFKCGPVKLLRLKLQTSVTNWKKGPLFNQSQMLSSWIPPLVWTVQHLSPWKPSAMSDVLLYMERKTYFQRPWLSNACSHLLMSSGQLLLENITSVFCQFTAHKIKKGLKLKIVRAHEVLWPPSPAQSLCHIATLLIIPDIVFILPPCSAHLHNQFR